MLELLAWIDFLDQIAFHLVSHFPGGRGGLLKRSAAILGLFGGLVMLLGGLAGTAAWQRWALQTV
jgi:hypothetical protein